MGELRQYTRYAEKKAGTNNKFYEVEAREREDSRADYTFRWGRIGTSGNCKQFTAHHFDVAKARCQAQFVAKLNRGYVEANAMEALASAIEDPRERERNGLEAVELVIPRFHTGSSEERCKQFCTKYQDKLNVIRGAKYALDYADYEQQIENLLKAYCAEWLRMKRTKAHGSNLCDNAAAECAARMFFKSLVDDAGCVVYGFYEGMGVR